MAREVSSFRLSALADGPPDPTLISSRAGRLVPVLEHLSECSSPLCDAGTNKLFEFFLGRPATSPCARLGGQRASVLRDEISAKTGQI